MPTLLAKLADLRALLSEASESDDDDALSLALAQASSIAEREAGVADGALRRRVGIIEYPSSDVSQSRYVTLRARPLESIASIKQVWAASSPVEFAAQESLTEYTNWVLDSTLFARLERVGSAWYLRPRCLQVIYTAGYLDPATTVAAWEDDEPYDAGDLVTAGGHAWCARSAHTSSSSNAPGDEATWAQVWQVPSDLQHGVIQQALRIWQTQEHAGVREVTNPMGGVSINLAETKPHPALIAATKTLRRLL